MPAPGESFLPYIAYWPGDPTGVPLSSLNVPEGTIVFDTTGNFPRIKVSPLGDNSNFKQVAFLGTATFNGAISSNSPTGGIGYVAGAGGAVTQITSNATPVTLNKVTGQITTVALSLAAGASAVFTVNNSTINLTDIPCVSSVYAGAGTLIVSTKNVTAGTFDVILYNAHATAALNALAIVNFAILRGSAS